ncbi:MAG: diacylglycerol kinase family lipid kinase [Chloroflexota bacterium]
MRVCLIANPRSRDGGIDLSEAILVLEAQGWSVDVWQKRHKGDATRLARKAAHEGYDMVCDCGGDGTLSEIVDGLVGTDVAVGSIPGGTVNVWARELGISRQPTVAATQLATSTRVRVDVGHLAINDKNGQHFLLMAGLGLDGAVMARVSRSMKNRIGPLAVGVAAVEAFPSFQTFPIRAQLDGVHWHGRISQIIVGNTRRYGGLTRVTPNAFVNDGLLDVCLITASGAVKAVRQVASLLLRQRPSDVSAEQYRVSHLLIQASTKVPLQLDGSAIDQDGEHDAGGGISYHFSSVPGGLTVMVPRTYDGALFEPAAVNGAHDRYAMRPSETKKKGKKRQRKKADKA